MTHWDLPVRLVHWALMVTVIGAWLTAEVLTDYMHWHLRLGYMSLGLLVFRVLWGFFGPEPARFTTFMRGPHAVFAHLRALRAGQPELHTTHNPAGGWAACLMWTLLLAQTVSGLFASDDIFYEGPYRPAVSGDVSDTLTGFHHLNFNLLLAVIAVHVVAVFIYQRRFRQPLVRQMSPFVSGPAITITRLLVMVMLAVLFVSGLLYFAPPPEVIDFY